MEPFQSKGMYDNGQYTDLVAIGQQDEQVSAFSEWDFFYIVSAGYKLKQYQECLRLFKIMHEKYPDFHKLDDKMCWSLYQVHLKGVTVNNENAADYRKRIDFILAHCSYSEYSPAWFVTKLIVKAIKDGRYGQQVDYAAILTYLEKIDPSMLSKDENSYESNGKLIYLASDMESWYADKCKAELKLGRYEDCIATANQALSVIRSFHSNNDSWFAYRKAQARIALGQNDIAQQDIQSILNRGFSHWCFYQILFEIDRDAGKADTALLQGCKCALADPSHEMRVSFYEEFADFLEQNEHAHEALLLRQLVILIRNENAWMLKEKHMTWQIPEDIASMNKDAILRELIPFWRKVKDSSREFYEGVIERLLPSGQDGFISGNGASYYFRLNDIRRGRNQVQSGKKVRFALENRLDRKKNVVKPAAVDIEVLG